MFASEVPEVAGRWYSAVNEGEIETALDLLAEDVIWVSPPDVPRPGSYRGHDNVREMWRVFTDAFSTFRIEPGEMESVEGRVVVPVTIAGRMQANGSPFEMRGAQVLEVDGGRIIAVREFLTIDEARRAARHPLARPE